MYLLVAEAAVKAGQIEGRVAKTPPVAFVPVAFAFTPRQDEAVKVVQQTVGGDVDVLHTHAVQVVQVVLGGRGIKSGCHIFHQHLSYGTATFEWNTYLLHPDHTHSCSDNYLLINSKAVMIIHESSPNYVLGLPVQQQCESAHI